MLIDNHVHMGWYSDGYHSPKKIWSIIESVGINKIAISSTSTCADLYNDIKREFLELITLTDPTNIAPILWISTNMLLYKHSLRFLLNSKIEWRGLKIHSLSHPLFYERPQLINCVIDLSNSLGKIPILIHTGEYECCHAKIFQEICENNIDVKFILAHGRPLKETIQILKRNENVWTDCSFMPLKDIKTLKNKGLSGRILFGTDIPIIKVYYPDISLSDYLKQRINAIKEIDPAIMSNTIYF